MVVPIERLSRTEKVKKYIGNNLIVNIIHNKSTLYLIGNNCKIKLGENSGLLKVVGDNCGVTVLQGNGRIEYIGNCGKILLGLQVSEENVKYIGNEGEITMVESGEKTQGKKHDAKKGAKSDKLGTSINICNANSINFATSCLPESLNISLPKIQLRTGENRHMKVMRQPKI